MRIFFVALFIVSASVSNLALSQKSENLNKCFLELKSVVVQNQTKMESLENNIENLKVRIAIAEAQIQSHEREILKLKKLLNQNQTLEDEKNYPMNPPLNNNDTIIDKIETKVQIQANFPGGERAFLSFFMGEFQFPKSCDEKGTDITILLRFVVDEAGRISNISVVESSKRCPDINHEAVRVLSISPRWVPGQNNGTFLKSWREIPERLTVE